jgi:hypothetical protein
VSDGSAQAPDKNLPQAGARHFLPGMRIILLLAVALLGCGGPLCKDTTLENTSVNSCVSHGGTTSQCQCSWLYIADRYSCADINASNIPVSVAQDAVTACR